MSKPFDTSKKTINNSLYCLNLKPKLIGDYSLFSPFCLVSLWNAARHVSGSVGGCMAMRSRRADQRPVKSFNLKPDAGMVTIFVEMKSIFSLKRTPVCVLQLQIKAPQITNSWSMFLIKKCDCLFGVRQEKKLVEVHFFYIMFGWNEKRFLFLIIGLT